MLSRELQYFKHLLHCRLRCVGVRNPGLISGQRKNCRQGWLSYDTVNNGSTMVVEEEKSFPRSQFGFVQSWQLFLDLLFLVSVLFLFFSLAAARHFFWVLSLISGQSNTNNQRLDRDLYAGTFFFGREKAGRSGAQAKRNKIHLMAWIQSVPVDHGCLLLPVCCDPFCGGCYSVPGAGRHKVSPFLYPVRLTVR